MPAPLRVTNEEIVAAYKETGSVWKAGKLLGLAGQSVHERLNAIGYKLYSSKWTDEELTELRSLVGQCSIGEAASRLGRSYAGVACKINELQIGTGAKGRPAKIPRGKGFDKASMKKHWKALAASDQTMTQYARANGMHVETFARACERHFPDEWDAYRQANTTLEERECDYCRRKFYPTNARHKSCSRKCQAHKRTDENYFGGKRRNTYGLAEGVCQMCMREVSKGLSSHHIFGKENDPENDYLIALCSGCHNIVTLLGNRHWDAEQWEAIISLAWMRKNGPAIAEKNMDGAVHVCVEIKELSPEDLEEM